MAKRRRRGAVSRRLEQRSRPNWIWWTLAACALAVLAVFLYGEFELAQRNRRAVDAEAIRLDRDLPR